jgi:ATP-dependent DNA ligase
MRLPLPIELEPMLASPVPEIPVAEGMSFEPKWDGFRCLIFRDGGEVELASRGGKTLTRYFPEVVEAAKEQLPERCVVDCELVVIRREAGKLPRLDFELLAQRIHPAASRVKLLATQTPAEIVAFDLLALGDDDLTGRPFAERRAGLEKALQNVKPPVHVTPATTDVETARRWFVEFEGAGLDGLIAKPAGLLYVPGKRLMKKIKHARTLDAVVAGCWVCMTRTDCCTPSA